MALPTLQLGDRDVDLVPQLRTKLVSLGFSVDAATTDLAIFDSAVQGAIMAFQRKVGIEEDGIVGPMTWIKLGADPAADPAATSWFKLALMAGALYFGYRWWKKRGANREFSLRGYGDAVDTRLIEEPLVLMERGDCSGAARMLMKRRVYASGRAEQAGTPVNRAHFKRVAAILIQHCPKEVGEEVEEAMRSADEADRTQGFPRTSNPVKGGGSSLTNIRRARTDAPWHDPNDVMHPRIHRGMRPIDTEPQNYVQRSRPVLPPNVGAGSRVIYLDRRASKFFPNGKEVIATVKKNGGSTQISVSNKGVTQTIDRRDVIRWMPKYAPPRAPQTGRQYTPEQKAKQAIAIAKLREQRKAAKREENDLTRRNLRREDGDRSRTVFPPNRGPWED